MIELAFSNVNQNAFVEVPLSQTLSLQTINKMKRKRRATTPPILPTPPFDGIKSTQHGSL
jgi:hypothetical protein